MEAVSVDRELRERGRGQRFLNEQRAPESLDQHDPAEEKAESDQARRPIEADAWNLAATARCIADNRVQDQPGGDEVRDLMIEHSHREETSEREGPVSAEDQEVENDEEHER